MKEERQIGLPLDVEYTLTNPYRNNLLPDIKSDNKLAAQYAKHKATCAKNRAKRKAKRKSR